MRTCLLSLEEKFVDEALSQLGCPYVWGGKGYLIHNGYTLKPHKFTTNDEIAKPLRVYDCSGLVTHSLWVASNHKIDLRATHSAKAIFDTFPVTSIDEDGCLLLYPGHVAICLGRGRVVDAQGGDETTKTPLDALMRNASVQAHRINRTNCIGVRRIPVDISELRKV